LGIASGGERHDRRVSCLLAGRLAAGSLVLLALGTACSTGRTEPDVEGAKKFSAFPLYWAGDRFERWELVTVEGLHGPAEFVTFIYGTCKPHGGDAPSCTPPLQIQVFPLCAHLEVVARAPIWKRRRIRGAPVGAFDSAPVLFTRGAQVKVYRGEGSDRGLPSRALRTLRSVNRVPPVVGPFDPIPPPVPGILDGTRRCSTK
jgi:hypothetical protein